MKKETYSGKKTDYLLVLLSLWFIVSILCAIVFVQQQNPIQWGGLPLGDWFAMQGSMSGFLLLIFIFIRLMNPLDARFEG